MSTNMTFESLSILPGVIAAFINDYLKKNSQCWKLLKENRFLTHRFPNAIDLNYNDCFVLPKDSYFWVSIGKNNHGLIPINSAAIDNAKKKIQRQTDIWIVKEQNQIITVISIHLI